MEDVWKNGLIPSIYSAFSKAKIQKKGQNDAF